MHFVRLVFVILPIQWLCRNVLSTNRWISQFELVNLVFLKLLMYVNQCCYGARYFSHLHSFCVVAAAVNCITHHALPLLRYSSLLHCKKRWVFSADLKLSVLRAGCRRESGSEFHSIGPAMEKGWRTNVLRRCRGTINWWRLVDLRRWRLDAELACTF